MYQETNRKSRRWIAIVLAVVLLLALILGPIGRQISQDLEEQSSQTVRDTVLRSAVQCYAVEGAYPSSLEYLEKHYGLVINHRKYIVSYDAYASNLAPNVRVLVRGG
jgi:hypothetical protein